MEVSVDPPCRFISVSVGRRGMEGHLGLRSEFEMNLRPFRTELIKDDIHDSRGKKNFPVRERHRRAVNDGTIERLDQILHPRIHVEIPCQESPCVLHQVPEIPPRETDRGHELLDVALQPPASKLDQCLVILIKNQTVFLAIDTKLMDRGPHLRREREIGRGTLLFTNDDSQFICDLAFVQPLE